MSKSIFVGIDTSNYTTSLAAVDQDGRAVSVRRLLKVEQGQRGLRQSDALFAHTVNLPELFSQFSSRLAESFGDYEIAALGVSDRPRRVEGSYMPCFLAGISAAVAASETLRKPLYRFSHQEGHIEAAVFGTSNTNRAFDPDTREFYAFHMSGGTCELVRVTADDGRYKSQIVANTLDITVGQLIDRSGVKLGMDFPCGAELERLAFNSKKDFHPSVKGDGNGGINLAGFENKFDSLRESEEPAVLAGFIFDVAVAAIKKMLFDSGAEQSGLPVLFAGGVMSSSLIRQRLGDGNYYFTIPEYATDNAVGTAILAKKRYIREEALK